MDVFSMKCYLSVAKYLNLSMAAKERFISQPAMSSKMNLLEEDFGVKLLIRSRQKVELTEAGKYIQQDVINGKLDVLFDEKSETDDVPSLESIFLFRDYAAVAVSKLSHLAAYEKASPDFLKTEKIIMSNNKSASVSLKNIVDRLSDAGFDMKNARLVDEYETTVAMAATGLGIAPIPRSFKVKNNSVTYVDIDSDKVYQDFVLTWSKYNTNQNIELFKNYCEKLKW